jgi:hypothetical protein
MTESVMCHRRQAAEIPEVDAALGSVRVALTEFSKSGGIFPCMSTYGALGRVTGGMV